MSETAPNGIGRKLAWIASGLAILSTAALAGADHFAVRDTREDVAKLQTKQEASNDVDAGQTLRIQRLEDAMAATKAHTEEDRKLRERLGKFLDRVEAPTTKSAKGTK